jgi:hypothetical protein
MSNVPPFSVTLNARGPEHPALCGQVVSPSEPRATLVGMDAVETMRQFALALLEAADQDGDVGAMTRFLVELSEDLDQDTLVGISTVAVTIMAVTSGVQVQTALEALWKAVGD